MSEVVRVDRNKWSETVAFDEPLEKKLQFPTSPIVFHVHGRYLNDGDRACYVLTIAPEPESLNNQISYLVEYEVNLLDGVTITTETGVFNETTTTSRELFVGFVGFGDYVGIKLIFKKVTFNQFFNTVNVGLRNYIEEGPTVTIVGSDGSVSVPRRLLKMRSKPLEAMFKHDSQEKRTGQIKMEDFDIKTLSAFKQFLMTGKIEDGKDTALGLVLLGDKYDIPAMKDAAEDFVKQNIHEMDEQEVLDILYRISRKTLVDAMIDSWSKK